MSALSLFLEEALLAFRRCGTQSTHRRPYRSRLASRLPHLDFSSAPWKLSRSQAIRIALAVTGTVMTSSPCPNAHGQFRPGLLWAFLAP